MKWDKKKVRVKIVISNNKRWKYSLYSEFFMRITSSLTIHESLVMQASLFVWSTSYLKVVFRCIFKQLSDY